MIYRSPLSSGVPPRTPSLMREALGVGALGLVFALVANALSPRGLPLTRPPVVTAGPRTAGRAPAKPETASLPRAAGPVGLSTNGNHSALAARLEARGLTLVHSNQVEQLFHDPRRESELVIFVDARDASQYEAGHIPGAYLLDPYRPERTLASVVAVCATAEQIVVYCPGGECEDSELAAGLLLDSGVPGSQILIYAGGLAEWIKNGLPVEMGDRRSGRMSDATP